MVTKCFGVLPTENELETFLTLADKADVDVEVIGLSVKSVANGTAEKNPKMVELYSALEDYQIIQLTS